MRDRAKEASALNFRIPAIAAGMVAALLLLIAMGAEKANAASWSHSGQIVATDGEGSLSSGIAFNQTSDQIFVSNLFGVGFPEPGRVLRIDTAGEIQDTFGAGYFDGVAVDPATGNVYAVNDSGQLGGSTQIETFTAAGVATGTPIVVPANVSAGPQIASDSAGNIYFPNATTDLIQVYQPNGTPLKTINGTGANALENPRGVAVDNAGNVYVVEGGGRTQKFDAAGNFVAVIDPSDSTGIGVDPVAGTVFVVNGTGEGTHVVAYDSSGAELADFGLGDFAPSSLPFLASSVAVDAVTGRVYVTDPGETIIETYDAAQAADATTQAASGVTSSAATLNATVNPNGSDADCEFEYATNEALTGSSKVPCSTNPVTGTEATSVSAALSSLAANTTYHYRVVTENEGGSANGATLSFKTLVNAPATTTGGASGITQNAATLSGSVDANQGEASCKFEWGTTAAYGKSVPCSVDPVSGDASTAVSAALSGLAAGTTYHYRVSATSAGGTANGGDMTFTTAAETCATNAALCPAPPVVTPPPPADNRNPAAYKVCVKKATAAYRKALKKAKGKAAKKAAKTRKRKAVKKCASRFL